MTAPRNAPARRRARGWPAAAIALGIAGAVGAGTQIAAGSACPSGAAAPAAVRSGQAGVAAGTPPRTSGSGTPAAGDLPDPGTLRPLAIQ